MAKVVAAAHPGYNLVQALRNHRDDEVLRLDGTSLRGADVYAHQAGRLVPG
jgi:hypothetical protein